MLTIAVLALCFAALASLQLRTATCNSAPCGVGVRSTVTPVSAAIALAVMALASIRDARAEFKVYSPYVVEGELELETRGLITSDRDAEKDGNKNFIYEVGYSPTANWHTAALLEQTQEHEPGESHDLRLEAVAWENILQLTEPGQYWADLGLYLEYEKGLLKSDAHQLETKLLIEKTIGRFTFTANPIFKKAFGTASNHSVNFEYAWAARYRWRPELEPGFEAFGDIGPVQAVGGVDSQVHQIGPDIRGAFRAGTGKILYNVGYLFGVSQAAPAGAVKFELEYELYF